MTIRLLTLREVAEYLNVSERTLYNQRSAGSEPGSLGFRLSERGPVRFRLDDIEEFIDRRRAMANEPSELRPRRLDTWLDRRAEAR